MSHIVIHVDNNDVTQYHRFENVQTAAVFLEQLHNQCGISNARLYSLTEVEFAVKQYVRIEIGGAEPAPAAPTPSAPAAQSPAPAPAPEAPTPQAEAAPLVAEIDTVEYVEAAMVTRETFAPGPLSELTDEALSSNESRRGLFGR